MVQESWGEVEVGQGQSVNESPYDLNRGFKPRTALVDSGNCIVRHVVSTYFKLRASDLRLPDSTSMPLSLRSQDLKLNLNPSLNLIIS
jgi:hypothetical protein